MVWISNNIHYKAQDEITYPFPNFNSCPGHWGLGMDKHFYPVLYWACDHLSMPGLKSTYDTKGGLKFLCLSIHIPGRTHLAPTSETWKLFLQLQLGGPVNILAFAVVISSTTTASGAAMKNYEITL